MAISLYEVLLKKHKFWRRACKKEEYVEKLKENRANN